MAWLLLVIDLLFLPWFSIGGGTVGNIPIPSVDLTATDAPDGWLGILAVLAALALIVDLAIERFSPQTTVPSIGGSRTQTRFVLGALTALFVALKFLFQVHFSQFGFGFWVAIVLAIALVYFVLQARGSGVGLTGGFGGFRGGGTGGTGGSGGTRGTGATGGPGETGGTGATGGPGGTGGTGGV